MIPGLAAIADHYDHFIIDIFGVIHDGIEPFPDTIATLRSLKAAGKEICLLSNSPRRANGTAGQLSAMNIGRDLYDHIVTSGETTHEYLRTELATSTLGKNCWFIDTGYARDIVMGLDLNLVNGPGEADFILNSIPGTQSSDAKALISNLERAVSKKILMICANPDLVVNIGHEQYECAGTFAKLYEDMGGAVLYHGKPHGPVYDRCYDLLGRPDKSRICAIGDSLHTDIAGATNFGIDSILNLAGIHRSDNLDLNNQPHRPRYVMAGFAW
jgi:HAD superfamily hydrolase (TIGR01459 family)